ncbi:MAG TPA: hypothetical protein VN743_12890 [Blastocatellia bacterium]|nr:hypothetical protein [Blastocatellia bacterium]
MIELNLTKPGSRVLLGMLTRETVIGVLITLLVTTLLALYLVHNLNPGD